MEPSPIAETGVGAPANDTTVLSTLAVICFPTLNGLPYFLVMRHLLEVCPLSRGTNPIQLITSRPSLFPASFTHIPIDLPYGSLS